MPPFLPANNNAHVNFVPPSNINFKSPESSTQYFLLCLNKGCESRIAHKVTPVKFNASVGFSVSCLLRLPATRKSLYLLSHLASPGDKSQLAQGLAAMFSTEDIRLSFLRGGWGSRIHTHTHHAEDAAKAWEALRAALTTGCHVKIHRCLFTPLCLAPRVLFLPFSHTAAYLSLLQQEALPINQSRTHIYLNNLFKKVMVLVLVCLFVLFFKDNKCLIYAFHVKDAKKELCNKIHLSLAGLFGRDFSCRLSLIV